MLDVRVQNNSLVITQDANETSLIAVSIITEVEWLPLRKAKGIRERVLVSKVGGSASVFYVPDGDGEASVNRIIAAMGEVEIMTFIFEMRLAPVRGVLQWTIWKKEVDEDGKQKPIERIVYSLPNDEPLLDDGEVIYSCKRRMVVKLDEWRFIDDEGQARLSFLDDVKVGR